MNDRADRDAEIDRLLELEEKMLADPLRWAGYLFLKREYETGGWEDVMKKQLDQRWEEGRQEGRREMVRNLLANGASPEIVAMSAGLSLEEVEALGDCSDSESLRLLFLARTQYALSGSQGASDGQGR